MKLFNYLFAFLILFNVSNAIAGDSSYTCEVLHAYELERDGSIGISGFVKQFRGSKFTVSKKDGKIEGYVLPTKLAKSTRVIQTGNTEYSFRSIADFGHDIQILDIREFVAGKQKPFVATALSGAGIVSGVCDPLMAHAQETQKTNKDLENISGQYAECTAYYELVSHALKSSNDPKTAEAYSKLGNTAMFYSLLLANEGRSKDLAVQVTNSRIEMYKKKMKQEANNSNENISILIDKYHFSCQRTLENPSNQITTILKSKIEDVDKQP